VRVAIATRDMKGLNAHFGSAPRFAVYDVTKDGWDFVEAVGFGDTSDESGSHKTDGDDRIGPKVEALAGCHMCSVSPSAGPRPSAC
jgi:nitrogen fixation protein NifX